MSDPKPGIKIRKLTLKSFKGIDELELSFPPPTFPGDPDVMVLGSANGVGKTAILEAIMLLVLLGSESLRNDRYTLKCGHGDQQWSVLDTSRAGHPITELITDVLKKRNFGDHFIKSTARSAELVGHFHVHLPEQGHGPKDWVIRATLLNKRDVEIRMGGSALNELIVPRGKLPDGYPLVAEPVPIDAVRAMMGITNEPFVLSPLMYFHSNRAVHSGPTSLAAIANAHARSHDGISRLKMEVVKALMAKSGLFEDMEETVATLADEKLQLFLKEFAEAKLGRLRSLPDNSLDIMVIPESGGDGYSFDALSSGEKEIISTLFLIWMAAREREHMILIDEPELHLNAQWHRDFIRQIHIQAPGSQIIMATHSEDVFASVEPERRLVIQRSDSPKV